jgi:hypothetical protein
VTGCDGNTSSWTPYVNFWPGDLLTGDRQFSLTGSRFAPGAVVTWGGRAQETTFVSDTALQVRLDAQATAVAGTFQVTTTNPGGYPTRPGAVTVYDAPLALRSLSPAAVPVGAAAFTLTLTGAGFTPGSQVFWNGASLATTFVSSGVLTAQVPATQTAVAGSGAVWVARCVPSPASASCVSAALACLVGTADLRVLDELASSAAWDSTRGLLYLASLYPSPGGPGTITAIDPTNGRTVTSAPANGLYPISLAISDDNGRLYYAANDDNALGVVTRSDLPGLGAAATASLGSLGRVQGLWVAPGAPGTVAADLEFGVAILDDLVLRGGLIQQFQSTYAVGWGLDAATLFIAGANGILKVDTRWPAPIITDRVPWPFGVSNCSPVYDRTVRRFFGCEGQDFDEHGVAAPPFPVPAGAYCMPVPDGALGKVFYACGEEFDRGSRLSVRSYSMGSHEQLATLLLGSVTSWSLGNGPRQVLRWGRSGLAVVGGSGKVYVYAGEFVR